MTKSEAIHHRALRCRPAKRNEYEAIHAALVAELGWAEEAQVTPRRRSLWQIIKGWFA